MREEHKMSLGKLLGNFGKAALVSVPLLFSNPVHGQTTYSGESRVLPSFCVGAPGEHGSDGESSFEKYKTENKSICYITGRSPLNQKIVMLTVEKEIDLSSEQRHKEAIHSMREVIRYTDFFGGDLILDVVEVEKFIVRGDGSLMLEIDGTRYMVNTPSHRATPEELRKLAEFQGEFEDYLRQIKVLRVKRILRERDLR